MDSGESNETTGGGQARFRPREDGAWRSRVGVWRALKRRVAALLVKRSVRLGCALRGAQNPVVAG